MPWRPSGLWRHQDFMKLWVGQTVSEFGSRITRDGLPLAAVLALGATPSEMGFLAAIGSAPILLVGLPAGLLVDRMPRRPILVAGDFGRAILLGSIPLAAILGLLRIELLYVIAVLVGILTVFFDVAYQSYLPSLVTKEQIVEGNSKLSLSNSVAEIGGPALAGVLVQTLTAPMAIFIDSLSFLFSALSISFIRSPEPTVKDIGSKQNVRYEAAQGLRIVFGNPTLRAIVGGAGLFSFSGGFFGALYYLFAIRDLGIPPAVLGVLIAAGGVGALLGALVAEPLTGRLGVGTTIVGALALTALLYMLIPLANGAIVVEASILGAAQLLGDLCWTVYSITVISLRQVITPNHLLGRVSANMRLVEGGFGMAGLITGGVLGEFFGIRLVLMLGASGILFTSLWMLLSPIRSISRLPEELQIDESLA